MEFKCVLPCYAEYPVSDGTWDTGSAYYEEGDIVDVSHIHKNNEGGIIATARMTKEAEKGACGCTVDFDIDIFKICFIKQDKDVTDEQTKS